MVSPHKDALGHSQAMAHKLHRNARVDHAFFACRAPNVLSNIVVRCHGYKLIDFEICNAKRVKKRMQ